MSELQNRTLICSVLFIDIVEYSQKAVAEQIALKDRLNTLLSEALRGVAVNDRIILDTGDGAAISFIGDPEDALFVATALRDAIQAQPARTLSTRIGINLGPVRLVKDINGRPNVIGDGINVAQRVMTFAEPGQVLVSRSYYEVVSRLSEETSKLFSYEGPRTDKHVREHEVYAVGAVEPSRRRVEPEPEFRKEATAPPPAVLSGTKRTLHAVRQRLLGSPPVATTLAVAAILMVAFVVRASREPPEVSSAAAPVVVPQKSVASPPPPRRPEPELRAEAPPPAPVPPTEPKKSAAQSPDSASGKPAASPPREPAAGETARPSPPERASQSSVVAAVAPATLSLAVAPWGEVHVNGKMHGVSPPLQELQLAPGKHRIELRNSGAPAHVVNVDAKPGERIRIKHKFK
jgi:class 3 adenylate cyclase